MGKAGASSRRSNSHTFRRVLEDVESEARTWIDRDLQPSRRTWLIQVRVYPRRWCRYTAGRVVGRYRVVHDRNIRHTR